METMRSAWLTARRRVIRQLLESMIHEGVIDKAGIETVGSLAVGQTSEWRIPGAKRDGQPVTYRFQARTASGFGRIRITSPITRTEKEANGLLSGQSGQQEALSVAELLSELLSDEQGSGTAERLALFLKELEHTTENDSFHPKRSAAESVLRDGQTLSDGEALTSTGHPYHPSYKSRIGFTLEDHVDYAPEFAPAFPIFWTAVHRAFAEAHTISELHYDALVENIVSSERKQEWEAAIQTSGLSPADYVFIPVHPWQWSNKIRVEAASLIVRNIVVPLGPGTDFFQPLQSIRTLANVTCPRKPNVKLSLQIMNTSALRIIGSHHIRNAAVISEWLHEIWRSDDFLREQCRVIILREIAGAALNYEQLPHPLNTLLGGSMSAVFRESLEPLIDPGDQAVPYTYVTHLTGSGLPAIDSWLKEYGAEAWARRLLEVTLQPLLHLLYAYGIGLESHGQNMVLILRNGWPVRIALRDLPGGVRCLDDSDRFRFAGRPMLPELAVKPGDDRHPILTGNAHDVRDFWMDALMHIQLHEVSLFIEQFGVREEQFWSFAAQEVHAYQKLFPLQRESFELFDLGAPSIMVGQLTARKIWGDGPEREHEVPNPLSRRLKELETTANKEACSTHGALG
ncbi:IucA/IucC family protein [Paenibacillus sedimenti]|uniref:IucA/IucC family siderophore biosynthesis protein n=1 Tax=Paenibacillus sedimenti TaxID=2770274 RepID=A0A926KT56_9BACL|nr:IucA/IucC family protein [Paenibacillus sedimenti]MBD0383535.1 hypothetical protein [Paenibacillus sedimenti]